MAGISMLHESPKTSQVRKPPTTLRGAKLGKRVTFPHCWRSPAFFLVYASLFKTPCGQDASFSSAGEATPTTDCCASQKFSEAHRSTTKENPLHVVGRFSPSYRTSQGAAPLPHSLQKDSCDDPRRWHAVVFPHNYYPLESGHLPETSSTLANDCEDNSTPAGLVLSG